MRFLLRKDNAYACDPRIIRHMTEAKEKKAADKKAKQDASRQKVEEEEKVSTIRHLCLVLNSFFSFFFTKHFFLLFFSLSMCVGTFTMKTMVKLIVVEKLKGNQITVKNSNTFQSPVRF